MPVPQSPTSICPFVGIDPGLGGGIAIIQCGDAMLKKMPSTTGILLGYLRVLGCRKPKHCYIEKQQGFIGKKNTAPSMFKLANNYGQLLMALTAIEIPFTIVTPQHWMKHMKMRRGKGETKPQWKKRLKELGEELYPKTTGITLKTADALLIAHVCMEQQDG